MRTRLWIVLLSLLAASPLVGFLPSLLGERCPLPADRRPAWAHLVFVTYDVPPQDLEPLGLGLALLMRRGTSAMLTAPADDDLAASAASLWSGQRLSGADLAALEGPISWTMASAAQRAGAATAAFLERPLVRDSKLSGFERVLEQPDLGPERLLELAHEHIRANVGRRIVLWLHLSDPGLHAERLDVLVSGVGAALQQHGLAWDTVWLATSLGTGGRAESKLWAWLPAAMYTGRQGTGRADGIAIAAVMEELLRLPLPDVTLGEQPLCSYIELSVLLRGGTLKDDEP